MKGLIKLLSVISVIVLSSCSSNQIDVEEPVIETEDVVETVKENVFDVEQVSDRLEVKNDTLDTATLFKVSEEGNERSFFMHPATLDLSEAREEMLTVCVWNDDDTIQTFEKTVKIGTDEEIAQVIKEKEKIAKAEEEKKAKEEADKKAKEEEKKKQEQTKKEENKATPTPTADTTQVASSTPVPSTPTPTEAPKYTYQCWNGQWAYDASGCPAQPTQAPVVVNTPAPATTPVPTPVSSTPQPTPQVQTCWDEQVLVKEAWVENVLVKEAYDEQVLVSSEWDEDVVVDSAYVCNKCGKREGYEVDDIDSHILYDHKGLASYGVIPVYETVHHPAEYKTVHHEAEYKSVQHPAEYKTERRCK